MVFVLAIYQSDHIVVRPTLKPNYWTFNYRIVYFWNNPVGNFTGATISQIPFENSRHGWVICLVDCEEKRREKKNRLIDRETHVICTIKRDCSEMRENFHRFHVELRRKRWRILQPWRAFACRFGASQTHIAFNQMHWTYLTDYKSPFWP